MTNGGWLSNPKTAALLVSGHAASWRAKKRPASKQARWSAFIDGQPEDCRPCHHYHPPMSCRCQRCYDCVSAQMEPRSGISRGNQHATEVRQIENQTGGERGIRTLGRIAPSQV